jgi:endonuclease YncB( thermonuclease family)
MKLIKKLLALVLVLPLALGLMACNNNTTAYVADNTEHYDSITKTLTLSKSYEGKDFLFDGIGKARVDAYTDGDTTRFTLESGDTVIVRYYSVDTPESTGDVEKWGKAASKFTQTQLKGASEIVLEATSTPASHDSYGTRYLGYVWYRESSDVAFKCLNLELVENGYSENKGVDTSAFPYNEYFKKAHSFAKSIQLRVHSSLDDPLYDPNPVEMTIKDFWANTDAYYNSDSDVGSKVVFTAYFESLEVSSSGTYTFRATELNTETGETNSINVYAAYSSNPASKMKLGHLYKIIGTVQNYNGSFQISGITYREVKSGDDDCKILQKNYYLTFNSSLTWRENFTRNVYTDLTITNVNSSENGKLIITGTAQLRTDINEVGEKETFTITVQLKEGETSTLKVGDKIRFSAYQFTVDSGELYVYSLSKINER